MKKVLITGANGLIGQSVARLFMSSGYNVIAAVRDIETLRKVFGDTMSYEKYDALRPLAVDFNVDIIIHAASPASPELFTSNPVETMLANIFGVRELLEYARRFKTKKVVYVSSSEVYGKASPRPDGFREEDYGFVDLLDVRSSYPMGKRAAETLCTSYAHEYGVNVSIARPGHIYGPTASKNDRRVSSAFAWKAARGEPIVMKSAGTSLRSYTHCDDCATAIMTVVEKGLSGEAYNVANRDGVCTIRQMAEIMADEGGVALQFEGASANDVAAFNPMDNSCLYPGKLEALGWRGKIGYEAGFRQTVSELRKRIFAAR